MGLDAQQKNVDAGGLAAVTMRNVFYKDHLKCARLVLYVLVFINVCLGYGIYHKLSHPALPQYFPATADGRLFRAHRLTDPMLNSAKVEQWSAHTLRAAFSLDYLHWQSQLTEASQYFTPRGWHYFLDAFQNNNNLSAIKQNKMVCDIQLTGSPNILSQGILNGRYTWKIQVPVELVFSGTTSITQTAMVTMLVQRANVVKYPQRIAINQILVDQEANSINS